MKMLIQITKFFSPFETVYEAQIVVDKTIAGAYKMAEKLNILGVMNEQRLVLILMMRISFKPPRK